MHPFEALSVHPALLEALGARGYTTATPVQSAVLADGCGERDLLVSARTGSGKTVAFGLTLAKTLLGDAKRFAPTQDPLVLVVAPTRELASQVARELAWLYAPAGARVTTCLGGMDFGQERRALDAGPHIVVGTPGRLCDHLDRGTLRLGKLLAVVLDEADEMLDMGFREDLETLLGAAPAERRTLLFSATFPPGIVDLARSYQRESLRVQATDPEQAHADITYRAHVVAYREREHAVVNVLREHEGVTALVFVATREGVAHLHSNLVERGFNAVPLSGELSQSERMRALKAVRDGRANVLVATDVAARGLDLPDLGLVVHADLPHDGAVLQHRSGRTGRAGKKGLTALLVPPAKRRAAERMLREASVSPEWSPVPTAEHIARLDEERILQDACTRAANLGEGERELGAKLLAALGPDVVASLLAVSEHGKRPVAEELPESAALHARADVQPRREPREAMQGGAWFRMNVGHAHQADPRWIVPILCRRGQIEKKHIGAIRIFTNETKVEIASDVSEAFEKAVRAPDRKDPSIRIAPCDPPGRTSRPRGDEPTPRAGRFDRDTLEEASPWERGVHRGPPARGPGHRPSGPPRDGGSPRPSGGRPFDGPRPDAGPRGEGAFRGPAGGDADGRGAAPERPRGRATTAEARPHGGDDHARGPARPRETYVARAAAAPRGPKGPRGGPRRGG